MSGSALTKAWRWSVETSPILHGYRWIRHRGYPNRKALALLEAAGLPKEVDALIRTTIKRSRLWSNERAEIARELIAHTHDAIQAGRTGDEIAASFGNPKHIAKLMRRSMKRKRPLYWRAYRNMKRATVAMILVLIVGYGSLAARFFLGKPKITRNYIAELNAKNDAYSEDEKAWGVYQDVDIEWQRLTNTTLEQQRARAKESQWKNTKYGAAGLRELYFMDQTHPDYEQTAELVRTFEPNLAKLRQAASRPVIGMPLSTQVEKVEVEPGIWTHEFLPQVHDSSVENSLVYVLLPDLGIIRKFSRILLFDANLAAAEGESDRVYQDISAAIGLGNQVRDDHFLIGSFVSVAISQSTVDALAKLIDEYPGLLQRDQSVGIAHQLEEIRDHTSLDLNSEMMFFDDALQRAYTDNGHGNGRMTRNGIDVLTGASGVRLVDSDSTSWHIAAMTVIEPVALFTIDDRRSQYQMYHSVREAAQRVLDDGPESFGWIDYQQQLAQNRNQGVLSKFSMVDFFTPSYTRALGQTFVVRMKLDAIETMLGIELFHRDTGRYPDSLDELSAQYLPVIPEDLFHPHHQLKYRLDQDGYILYSAGSDGDDDGGREPIDEDTGLPDRDRNRFILRFKFETQEVNGEVHLLRDQTGQPVEMPPSGPDGDWILVDMRRMPETMQEPIPGE